MITVKIAAGEDGREKPSTVTTSWKISKYTFIVELVIGVPRRSWETGSINVVVKFPLGVRITRRCIYTNGTELVMYDVNLYFTLVIHQLTTDLEDRRC